MYFTSEYFQWFSLLKSAFTIVIAYPSNTKFLVIDGLYYDHIINPNEELLTEIALWSYLSGLTRVNDLPDHNLTEDLKKLWETIL